MSAVSHHWHDFDRGYFRRAALRTGLAAFFILATHTAAVYAMLNWPAPEASAPPAAMMVELAALPVSAPSQQEDLAPGPEMNQSLADPTPDAPDVPDDSAPPPEPVVEQVIEKLPEIPPTPAKSDVVLPKPEPEKKKVEKPRPKQVEKPKPDAKPTKRQRAPVTAAAPRSEAPVANTTAAPSAGASASRSMSRATWAAMISAHLNRHKRYPPGAQGVVGTPAVAFSLTGSGGVTSVRLVRSSGSSVLDDEAVATVRRASPFPGNPDGQGGNFTVPVRFTSR